MSNKETDSKARDEDATSQFLLGKAYFRAVYDKDNCLNAFKWIHLSAEQGNMEAQFRLADLFALGQGAPKSYKDAYEWYTKAALQGYRKASIRIFNLYQQDRKMHSRGRLSSGESKWTDSKFKEENNIRELNEYRLKYYESKLNHAINYYTELFKTLKSENQEDSNTSFKLGFLYQYGYGVKKCIKLAIDYYKKAAEQGNRDAQYHLGYLYEKGTDIKFNYRLAIHWYRTSATSGNIAAQNALGYFYEKGLATELNVEAAIYWYTKAADAGNSDAQLTLGRLYRKGEGAELDISQAIKWYTSAASQGNGVAQNCLNQLYQHGKNQPFGINNNKGYIGEYQIKPTLRSKLQDDIEQMSSLPNIRQLKKLVEHALRTDGNAMFTLGMKYYNGEDFTQDKDTGFQWVKKAAKTGLQKAEMKVAEMYDEGGNVVDQDYHESSIWTAKMAKQKNSMAQCDLGLLYLHGKGVRKDPLEASKWFTKSADQGNAEAQCQFGLLRSEGLGLRKDTEEALEWLNKSALNGNTNALYKLAQFYQTGKHLEIDVDRALKLYEYSAENGNWDSQFRLAELYEKGELVHQDLQKAESYYELAANSFDEYQQYQLALKYMNGDFGHSDYVRAFELFKQIADETPYCVYNIFREPISNRNEEMDYMRMLDMLILVSKRGGQEACYYIGHFYENGITTVWNEILLHHNYTEAIYWYSIAVTNGDSRAEYRLGAMYEKGKGMDVDLAVAYNYYVEAYGSGNMDAAYRLAVMYMNGEVVTLDKVKAYCLFTEAANKGHEGAIRMTVPSKASDILKMLEAVGSAGYVAVQYQLGVFYQNQNKNNQKAMKWFALTADNDVTDAFYMLDMTYEAIKWLTLAAKNGVTDAYYRLGVIHEALKGNDENCSKAIHCYSVAVERDHEYAMYRLARIYHLDGRVIRDYQKAYDLYSKAAELGHIESSRILNFVKHSIGYSYTKDETIVVKYSKDLKSILLMIKYVATTGNVRLQHQLGIFYISNLEYLNHNDAFKWFQMAASKEHTDAIYQLGLLCEHGQGTIQDYRMAYSLYIQAKEKGHRDAIYRLGIAYHYGLGVDVNTSEATNCYIKAAELGSDESQYKLGKLYESGNLVEKDGLKALEWYTKAYLNGNYNAIKDLYQLYNEESLESFFYQRLFSILSNIENIYISDEDKNDYSNRQTYGSIYFKLGMIHFNGQGTAKNIAKALKQFLKAFYDYGNQEAGPFISLEYSSPTLILQNTYLDILNAYLEIRDQIPSEHQYELGMLYYSGVRYVSGSHKISGNPDLVLVLAPDHSLAFRYFKLASQSQHPDAQHQLGLMYLRGHGVIKSYQIALKWFTAASESMDPHGCYRLGVVFFHGDKVEQDYEIARIYLQKATEGYMSEVQSFLDVIRLNEIEWELHKSNKMDQFEKEVEKIDPDSLYDRGVALYKSSSEGVENHDISSFYIKKAAEKNHKEAIFELVMMYLERKTFEKDENEALKWIEKSIEVMDPDECYEKGLNFYNDKNYEISLLYMKQAAKENNGHAQYYLGLMYIQGLGVEKNHEQAMKWFEQSTMQLDSDDCVEKGKEFYKSVKLGNNYEIALLYLQKAAKENDGYSQAQLGLMYLQGLGVEKNKDESIKWVEKSLKYLSPDECYEQGMTFYIGTEVYPDHGISLLYLRKAAERYHGLSQAQLALMYLEGTGVEKNYGTAMELIQKSMNEMKLDEFYRQGMAFYRKTALENNYDIALKYLKRESKANAYAQAQLGYMYKNGIGVDQSHEEADRWLNIVENNCIGKSRFCRSKIYHYDQGGMQDFSKAFKLYQEEMESSRGCFLPRVSQNKPGTLRGIGLLYEYGDGVIQDLKKAMEYYERSILEEKNSFAYYNIGLLYYYGKGVDQSYKEALIWFTVTASLTPDPKELHVFVEENADNAKNMTGSSKCTYSLQPESRIYGESHYYIGLMYRNGYGVDQDEKRAQNNFKMAHIHGIERAKMILYK